MHFLIELDDMNVYSCKFTQDSLRTDCDPISQTISKGGQERNVTTIELKYECSGVGNPHRCIQSLSIILSKMPLYQHENPIADHKSVTCAYTVSNIFLVECNKIKTKHKQTQP